jgi:hypothetical protein
MPTWRIIYYVREMKRGVVEGYDSDEAYHKFKKENPVSEVIAVDCHSSV